MRSVILSAGRSCFVACRGCYNHFSRDRELIDTPVLLDFVAKLRQEFGLSKITVGGGDPLTRPDLIKLLAGLRRLGLRINLDTVGTAFLRDAQIRFMGRGIAAQVDASSVVALVDSLGIPLDGCTDASIRTFRHHGSFADQEAVLSLLDRLDAPVCANTVVHARNRSEVPQLADLISRHPSVRAWQLFQFMPLGPLGWRNRGQFLISALEFQSAARSAHELGAAGVKVIAKSAASRKNRYLLIDTAGVIWVPSQMIDHARTAADETPLRRLVSHINEPDVIAKVQRLEEPDEYQEST